MGDTFSDLATSISAAKTKHFLWLTSQMNVIISRVHQLSSLHFVGGKTQTRKAIYRNKEKTATFVPCSYNRNQFETSKTETGFVYLLVSLVDKTFSTSHLDETSDSWSKTLRSCNSTEDSSMLDQSWAMGYFVWQFHRCSDRNHCPL